jgi:DNA topoisomerase-2
MAQGFVGARNLPLLQPHGLFGTRDQGYKNPGASRYIMTSLNENLVSKLFRKEDEYILEYNIEDGTRYEPKYYVPIIPYVLCENNELPATGWDICIHARDLKSIFKNIRNLINGTIETCDKLPIDLTNFKGDIRVYKNKRYFVGNYEYDEKDNSVTITELPPSLYSKKYLGKDEDSKKAKAKQLKSQVKNTKQKTGKVRKSIQNKEWIEDSYDYTDNEVNIKIYLKEGAYDHIVENYGNDVFDPFEQYLELTESIHDRINLVNENGEVIEYKNYEKVFMNWYNFRKNLYSVRVERETILNELEILLLKNMQRFSTEHDKYNITRKTTEVELIEIFKKNKYNIFNKTLLNNPKFTELNELIKLITDEKYGASYDYLLDMGYRTLTKESFDKREKQLEELEKYKKLLIDDEKNGKFRGAKVWERELDELELSIEEGKRTQWFYGENTFLHMENKDGTGYKSDKYTNKSKSNKSKTTTNKTTTNKTTTNKTTTNKTTTNKTTTNKTTNKSAKSSKIK